MRHGNHCDFSTVRREGKPSPIGYAPSRAAVTSDGGSSIPTRLIGSRLGRSSAQDASGPSGYGTPRRPAGDESPHPPAARGLQLGLHADRARDRRRGLGRCAPPAAAGGLGVQGEHRGTDHRRHQGAEGIQRGLPGTQPCRGHELHVAIRSLERGLAPCPGARRRRGDRVGGWITRARRVRRVHVSRGARGGGSEARSSEVDFLPFTGEFELPALAAAPTDSSSATRDR